MSKNSVINFVGQPILKQIVDLLSVIGLKGIADKHKSDRYYKQYSSYTDLVTMILAFFLTVIRCTKSVKDCVK